MDTIGEVIVGETLFLEILMPDGEWFELQGVVARDSPGLGFGVRFRSLNEYQEHRICSLLKVQELSPARSADTFERCETFIPFEQIDLTSRVVI